MNFATPVKHCWILHGVHFQRSLSTAETNVLPYVRFEAPDRDFLNTPVIFLHGFLGNKRNNRSAGKQLAHKLNSDVIIPDLRNHGKAFHAAPMNYKVLTKDLEIMISKLYSDQKMDKSKGLILLGHSMGGKLAMIFSLLHPDSVRGVVSIDNVPFRNPVRSLSEFEKFHIALKEIESCIIKYPHWTLEQLKTHLLKWVEPNEFIVDFYLTNVTIAKKALKSKIPIHLLRDSIENILEWRLEEYGDLDKYADQRNVPPLLLLRATKSEFVGSDLNKKKIQKWFPKVDVVDIDSSHWIVTEKREQFVSSVEEWINANCK